MRDFSAGEDGSSGSGVASRGKSKGNLLAHSTRRQRGNFDAPGHLLSFLPEQKSHNGRVRRTKSEKRHLLHSAKRRTAAGARISDLPETVGRSIQLIESTDGFPRAPHCINWIENCWQQREKREIGRTQGIREQRKKEEKSISIQWLLPYACWDLDLFPCTPET